MTSALRSLEHHYNDVYGRAPTLDRLRQFDLSTHQHGDSDPSLLGGSRGRYRGVLDTALEACPGRLILDLGCGLNTDVENLAAGANAAFIGVDASEVAIVARSARAERTNHRFLIGTFECTHLAEKSVSACFSVDALYLSSNRWASLSELSRILAQRGTLIMTAFYATSPLAEHLIINNEDWCCDLEGAGFRIRRRIDVTDEWRRTMRAKHRRRLEHADFLRTHLGPCVEPELSVSRAWLGAETGIELIAYVTREELHARFESDGTS